MSDDKVEAPKRLGRFEADGFTDEDKVIIQIAIRAVELKGKKNKALGIGIGAGEGIIEALKKDDQFRYAVREAFIHWLDTVTGVV